jgi:hypothetical protein
MQIKLIWAPKSMSSKRATVEQIGGHLRRL